MATVFIENEGSKPQSFSEMSEVLSEKRCEPILFSNVRSESLMRMIKSENITENITVITRPSKNLFKPMKTFNKDRISESAMGTGCYRMGIPD